MPSLIDPNEFKNQTSRKVLVRALVIDEPRDVEVRIKLFTVVPSSNKLYQVSYSHGEFPMSFSDLIPLEVAPISDDSLQNTIVEWGNHKPTWLSDEQIEACHCFASNNGKRISPRNFKVFCNCIRLHQRLMDLYQETTIKGDPIRDVVLTFLERFDGFMFEHTKKIHRALNLIAEFADLAG